MGPIEVTNPLVQLALASKLTDPHDRVYEMEALEEAMMQKEMVVLSKAYQESLQQEGEALNLIY